MDDRGDEWSEARYHDGEPEPRHPWEIECDERDRERFDA